MIKQILNGKQTQEQGEQPEVTKQQQSPQSSVNTGRVVMFVCLRYVKKPLNKLQYLVCCSFLSGFFNHEENECFLSLNHFAKAER